MIDIAKDWYEKWKENFPPLDIEHANEEELMRMRMIGMTRDEEVRARKRAQELGIWEPIEKPKDK